MAFKVSMCALLLSASLAAHAETRVHTVPTVQSVILEEEFSDFGTGKVAIDGEFSIVIENVASGRVARLWQRGANGQWTAGATLLTVQTTTPAQDDDLVMANGVAALRIGNLLHIFERSGNTYVESATAGTPQGAPGMAISGRNVLVARRGCNYSADLHQKSSTSGVWNITSRIVGPAGECNDHGAALDLDGNVALLRVSPVEIREYLRNGATWTQVGVITPPPGATWTLGAPTLSGNVAFVSEGRYFERSGSTWVFRNRVRPLDAAMGTSPFGADYRGGLLITKSMADEFHSESLAYLYLRNNAGLFDHVAVLGTSGGAASVDVSGSRAVVAGMGFFGETNLQFFELPEPLRAPAAIANDFDARDISRWQQEPGSQFALVNTPRGVQYRQASLAGKATAFLTNSDWSNAQSIEADIIPRAINGSSWVGLALRYVDADNQYYVTLRNNNRLQLKRNVAGVFTTLADVALPFALNRAYHVKFIDSGSRLQVYIDGAFRAGASDSALTHGRAALMTFRARADYDNVYAGTTPPFTLAFHDYDNYINDPEPEFTEVGGNWQWVELEDNSVAVAQLDTSVDARRFVGTPTGDQVVETLARADSFDPNGGGWVGLLARWVDPQTYYYMALRSSGRLDIRKRAHGTITVLKTVPFTLPPGEFHRLKFVAIGNQLHAYVDEAFIAGAVDDEIPRGSYGMGTSHAAASFKTFGTEQP